MGLFDKLLDKTSTKGAQKMGEMLAVAHGMRSIRDDYSDLFAGFGELIGIGNGNYDKLTADEKTNISKVLSTIADWAENTGNPLKKFSSLKSLIDI